MVSNNKILTVSYGTFSCTLEGFDDSFDTMKAIAEYFRDLAADDRYFGAEPPTPDAEMLARIAEREIARRVEAHEDQGKIHLRADDVAKAPAAASPVPVAPAIAPAAETPLAAALASDTTDDATDIADTQDADIQGADAQDAEPPAPDAVDTPAKDVSDDNAEETAEQIEEDADTAEAEPAQPEEPVQDAVEEIVEESVEEVSEDAEIDLAAELPEENADAFVEAQVAETEEHTDATAQVFTAEDSVHAADEADVEEPAALAPLVEAEAEPEAPASKADDSESVAEKLRRIRSVVAQSDMDYSVSDYTEDEHANDPMPSAAAELDALLNTDADSYASEDSEEQDADDTLDQIEAALAGAADAEDEAETEADETLDLSEFVPEASDETTESLEDEEDTATPITDAPTEQSDVPQEAPIALSDFDGASENELADDGSLDLSTPADATATSDEDTLNAIMADLASDADDEADEGATDIANQADISDAEETDLTEPSFDPTPNAEVEESAGADQTIPQPKLEDGEDTLAQLLADAAPVDASDKPEIAVDLDRDMPSDAAEDEAPESLFADLDDRLDADAKQDDASALAAPLVLGSEARVQDASTQQPVRPLNARVLKMKKSEFQQAISQGMIEEDPDPQPEPETTAVSKPAIDPDALLSPEDEADLQRQLAEVEAELDDFQQDTPDATAADTSEQPLSEAMVDSATPGNTTHDADEDDLAEDRALAIVDDEKDYQTPSADLAAAFRDNVEDLDQDRAEDTPRRGLSRLIGMTKRAPEDEERIFDKADSQMGDKDASMRRTAIQHLRAAVAATRAEKSAGVDVDQGVDETPYRSDLAQVVRPRRPVGQAATERPERPTEQRPAPLKLVAEQRVDIERAPVRPRRVSTVPVPDTGAPGGSFNDFAKDMGASELSDLLEAAAAYMSDVEGHSEFTRPMLMGKLKEVRQDGYSREDGLRSFGQLLRDGKLRKLKGGRFAATDETEYRAKARNAG